MAMSSANYRCRHRNSPNRNEKSKKSKTVHTPERMKQQKLKTKKKSEKEPDVPMPDDKSDETMEPDTQLKHPPTVDRAKTANKDEAGDEIMTFPEEDPIKKFVAMIVTGMNDASMDEHAKELSKLWSNPIRSVSVKWLQKFKNHSHFTTKPFEVAFGEEDSLHDAMTVLKAYKPPSTAAKEPIPTWFLKAMFQLILIRPSTFPNDEHLSRIFTLIFRLWHSDPKKLFDKGMWKDGSLLENDMTNTWVVVYLLLGAPWNANNEYFFPKKSTVTPDKGNQVMFLNRDTPGIPEEEPETFLPAARPMFISRQPRQEPTRSVDFRMTYNEFNNVTYCKMKLPAPKTERLNFMEKEVCQALKGFLKTIWRKDASVAILPWGDMAKDKISQNSPFPSTKSLLLKFVDRLYLDTGRNPYIRFRMGHNKAFDAIDDDEVKQMFKDSQCFFYKEKIQEKYTAKLGFLVGIKPEACNLDHLALALGQVDSLANIPLDLRTEAMKLDTYAPPSKAKAVHIYCADHHVGKARQAFDAIYSTTNKTFPLMLQARFIPNGGDTRFLITARKERLAKKAVSKQELFARQTVIARNVHLLALDWPLESLQGKTCREMVMSIRSKSFPDRNLFVSVAEFPWQSGVCFCFEKSLASEARSVISALPLVLESFTGGTHIWTWFADAARIETEGFRWDPKEGLVEILPENSIEDDIDDVLAFMHLEDIPDELIKAPDDPLAKFELKSVVGRNQYNDNGTVASHEFRDPASVITASTTGTMNTPSTITQQSKQQVFASLKNDPSLITEFVAFLNQSANADHVLQSIETAIRENKAGGDG